VSWLSLLRFGWETAIGAVELGVGAYDKAKHLLRGQPAPASNSQPLTYRDVVRQQKQIRSATRPKLPPLKRR